MPKTIKLTKGFETIVDDDMFEELNAYNWYAACVNISPRPARRLCDNEILEEEPRRLIYIYHQILKVNAWELRPKGLCVDHINRNTLDNRRENIRVVTHTENMLNTMTSLNKRGVGINRTHNTWKAYLDFPNKKRINIGTYQTEELALQAVALAKEQYACA